MEVCGTSEGPSSPGALWTGVVSAGGADSGLVSAGGELGVGVTTEVVSQGTVTVAGSVTVVTPVEPPGAV